MKRLMLAAIVATLAACVQTSAVAWAVTGQEENPSTPSGLPPVVSGLAPASGPAGTSVGVSGDHFDTATGVFFGSTPARFEVDGYMHLTAVAPAGVSGAVDVTVVSPYGTSGTVPEDVFTYPAPPPPPPAPEESAGPPSGFSDLGAVLRPSGQSGPRVLQVISPENPVAGQPATFTIVTEDDDLPVSGASFDFGESGGLFGESACRLADLPRRGTFSVTYTFETPGPHTVSFEVHSGGCDTFSRVTSGEVTVDVAPGAGQTRAAIGPDAALRASRCRNADTIPTSRNRKATVGATRCLLNAVRRAAGLRRLKSARALTRIAGQHSRDMVARRFFDHTAPVRRTFVVRLRSVRWRRSAGENIGFGTGSLATPRKMMSGWMRSSGHRANILTKSFRHIGIGLSAASPLGPARQAATYTTDFGG